MTSDDSTDLGRLSTDELLGRLRTLQRPTGAETAAVLDRMEETIQELHVHRIELEMQNRAMQEAQSELEDSISRYSDLYDHLPMAYVTVTADGRVIQANVAACNWLQRERSLLVGTYLRKFLDAYDSGRLAAHLEGCVRNGGPSTLEVTLRMPDGMSVAAMLSSRMAPGRGADPQIHTAITDISAFKKTQRVLEDINREQETFNASISHDLRAPLITITNYAQIVIAEHSAQLDEEGRTMLDRIQRAAGRMERTLKQLMEYGTLAREDASLEPVQLDQAVRNVLLEHQEVIKQSSAEIVNICPALRVRASRNILGIVLTNLLTNALKFVEPGKKPNLRITAEKDGDMVLVKFADEGIGIDEKYHQQVFQVFERLHGYSRYPGTGIGLAIAQRGVERMNGRIWVVSKPGKGSCFHIHLRPA